MGAAGEQRSDAAGLRGWSRRGLVGGALLALAPAAAAWTRPVQAVSAPEPPALEPVLRDVLAKLGDDAKKTAALLTKVDKAVRKALASTPLPGTPATPPRFLDSHPYLVLVNELSAPLRVKPGKPTRSPPNERLARHPWDPTLELVEGLRYGSDRPVPAHENGFIELGSLPALDAALPDPGVNQYLYGLREVVGWRASVLEGAKNPLAFRGRTAKDPAPAPASELPPWEALRTYLRGSLPEVSLFAVPRLTHLLHARLAERRSAGGEAARMDELLALLDAHWNGFTFRNPTGTGRTAIALPIFTLIADRQGFVYRFATGAELGTTGDIPFVSDPTLVSYARALRKETLAVGDFIAGSAPAEAARSAFWQDCTYLSRYRALLELVVRAVLEPCEPLPPFLADHDFPAGGTPERRTAPELDVARKHALLLWARAGRDPAALADFLFEQLLDLELNRFPKNAVLKRELATLVTRRDGELLGEVLARAARARSGPELPSDFEREFSAHATYLDASSPAASDYLVHSHHAFHAPVRDTIRAAALEVVLAELGAR